MDNKHDDAEREQRLQEALVAYLEAVEADRVPEAKELLAQYPEFADELAEFLANRDQIDQLAAPLRQAVEVAQRTIVNDAPTLAPGTTLPPQVGTSIRYFGEYELLDEIARGGMGVVFRARQTTLKRIVALKMILSGQLAGEEEVKRFYAEAEAAAKLDHPNIVPIFEIGQHDGQHYFSMSFIEGESLAHKVADGPVAPREAAELVKKIAVAIAYAHTEGVIHRDLKPGNVLVDRDGEPRITDFGLAKRVEGDSDLTSTGQVVGTPSYMPPEQASGKLDEVGPLADVYAAGGVLYCLLTARPPFQAANPLDTLLQVLEKDPVPVRDLVPQVPRDLETICLKCLEKEPRRRYGSAGEFAEDLQRFLDGEPVKARPISRPARLWRWCRRKPVVAGLTAAVTLLLLTLSIAGPLVALQQAQNASEQARLRLAADQATEEEQTQRERANEKAAEAQRETERAEEEKERAETQLLRSEWLLYAMQIASAQREWETDNFAVAQAHLNDCRADFRGWEHNYLTTLFTKDHRTFTGHNGIVVSVAFSPDGKRIVSGGGLLRGELKVWDVGAGEELLTLDGHAGYVSSVAFGPDGERIVSGSSDKTLKLWDASTGEEMHTLKGLTSQIWSVAFGPDGKMIISASDDGTVKGWDATSGQEAAQFKGHTGTARCVTFSPDGNRIISGGAADQFGNVGEFKVWNASTGEEILTIEGHTGPVCSTAFSPDGKYIVSGSMDGTLKTWDASTAQDILTIKGHTLWVTGVAVSPDGKQIVSGSYDKTVKVWDASTGEEVRILKGHSDFVRSVAFSPDGEWIVSGSNDKTVKVWNTSAPRNTVTFKGDRFTSDVAFSPDGKRIASASLTGKSVKVWDASTGERTIVVGGSHAVAFSPDGKRIVTGGGLLRGELRVWDASTGKEVLALEGHDGVVRSLAVSPDGKWIVSGSEDKTIRLWDASTGEEMRSLLGHAAPVISVAFSHDGKRIVSGAGDIGKSGQPGELKLWDAGTGEEIRALKGEFGAVVSVAFSPDDKWIVSGGGGINLGTLKSISQLKLWDASTGEEIRALKGHTASVSSVAFSPNGKRIVSGSWDQTIKLWEPGTGQQVLTLKAPNLVHSVALSPDGNRILSGSQDGTLKLWVAEPEPVYASDKRAQASRSSIERKKGSAKGLEISRKGIER